MKNAKINFVNKIVGYTLVPYDNTTKVVRG